MNLFEPWNEFNLMYPGTVLDFQVRTRVKSKDVLKLSHF